MLHRLLNGFPLSSAYVKAHLGWRGLQFSEGGASFRKGMGQEEPGRGQGPGRSRLEDPAQEDPRVVDIFLSGSRSQGKDLGRIRAT